MRIDNHQSRPADLRDAYVFSSVFLVLLYRFLSGGLFGLFTHMPLAFPPTQHFYKPFYTLNIFSALSNSGFVNLALDLLLLSLPFLYLIFKKQSLFYLWYALLLLYFLAYNAYSGHNYHGLVGILVLLMPYFRRQEENRPFLWDAVRYYFLYFFSSAGLWKLTRGIAFHPFQMSNILREQHLESLYYQPNGLLADWQRFLMLHPTLAQSCLIMVMILQLAFVIGFISRKFDKWLIVLFLLFCLLNYISMNIISFELIPLALSLVNWPAWHRRLFPDMEIDPVVKQG